jgi:predicted RNA-binding protein with RPS1 domain
MGTVKNITEYGAFVDLGRHRRLLHITDMSWGRINHPSEVLNVGDEIKVQVLKFDREASASPSATSSSRPIPGPRPPSSTRWACASRARS